MKPKNSFVKVIYLSQDTIRIDYNFFGLLDENKLIDLVNVVYNDPSHIREDKEIFAVDTIEQLNELIAYIRLFCKHNKVKFKVIKP